jgi:hypothetical protein
LDKYVEKGENTRMILVSVIEKRGIWRWFQLVLLSIKYLMVKQGYIKYSYGEWMITGIL